MAAVRLITSFSTLAAEFDVRYAILVVLVLFTASLLASFVPALRARNASPVMLLRDA